MSDISLNFRPYKGADVGEGARGAQSKIWVIWSFGYRFNILKYYSFLNRIKKLLKNFLDLQL